MEDCDAQDDMDERAEILENSNKDMLDEELPFNDLPDMEWKYRGSAPSSGNNESYNGGAKDELFDGGHGRVPEGLRRMVAGGGAGNEDGAMHDGDDNGDESERK